MSRQTTFKDSPSVTSSLALEFGHSLFAAQDGRIIDQSGREVAHANASGAGAAFADPRHLWPSFAWLIKEFQPPIIFGEQVASKAIDTWVDLVHAGHGSHGLRLRGVRFPVARGRCAAHQGQIVLGGRLRRPASAYGWWSSQLSNGNRVYFVDLNDFAMLAGWPTPVTRDHFFPHTRRSTSQRRASQGHGMSNLERSRSTSGLGNSRGARGTEEPHRPRRNGWVGHACST